MVPNFPRWFRRWCHERRKQSANKSIPIEFYEIESQRRRHRLVESRALHNSRLTVSIVNYSARAISHLLDLDPANIDAYRVRQIIAGWLNRSERLGTGKTRLLPCLLCAICIKIRPDRGIAMTRTDDRSIPGKSRWLLDEIDRTSDFTSKVRHVLLGEKFEKISE